MVIEPSRLRELLDYDPDTGVFRWKQKPSIKASRVVVGAVAGNPTGNGYLRIRIDNMTYMAHVLAWFYVHGVWPKSKIDHRDCDGFNNRIRNLREASDSQNGMNKRRGSNSTSGIKGVFWDNHAQKWRASIRVNGKKRFLGSFANKGRAALAYASAAKRYHGDFARLA